MVDDYERARDALAELAGLEVAEDDVTTDPVLARRGGFNWLADVGFEISQPVVPGSAGARFLEQFGTGMHSVGIQIADLDATIAHLDRVGVRVTTRPMPFWCFSHPSDTAGLLVEWNQGRNPRDRRWDPEWRSTNPPASRGLLDVHEVAFCAMLTPDPINAARRIGDVVGTGLAFARQAVDPGEPVAGVSLGDCMLAFYDLPDAQTSARLWGQVHERRRLQFLGLRCRDLDAARAALEARDVRIVRAGPGCVVPHPDDTGGIALVLVDDLLPGDARTPGDEQ
jgi:hypothetical protein